MDVLERLETEVERFNRLIVTLPSNALEEQDWGPKEVLAHLVYHHEKYAAMVEGFLADAPVDPPKGRYRDLNAEAVALSRGVDPEVLVDRFYKANQRLVELYRQCDPGQVPMEI